MLFRILLISGALLLTTVSCLVKTEPESKVTTPEQGKIPYRAETRMLLGSTGLNKAIGYIRCGGESFPICYYRKKSGFSGMEEWGFWTDSQRAEIQFAVPWFMLGKDITLFFPVTWKAFIGRQQEILTEFLINGKSVFRQKFNPKHPPSLELKVPAGLNYAYPLKLSILFHTSLQRVCDLDPKSRDPRKVGWGFCFTKTQSIEDKSARGIFEIRSISAPDKNGFQSAELCCLDHLHGSLPRMAVKTVLSAGVIPSNDPVKRFCKGELLELTLIDGKPERIIFGRFAGKMNPDLTGNPAELTSAYPPYRLPVNPPLPAQARQMQQKQIAGDMPLIRGKLKNIRKITALDERFQRAWLQRQKNLETIPRIISLETGQEIERFQNRYCWKCRGDSCFSLPKDYHFVGKTGIQHNIVALHSLHQLLHSCNIQLLIVLIPDAGQIAARALVPEVGNLGDLTALQCASTMLEYGMEAIYADDAVMSKVSSAGRLFCYPDPNPEADLWKILAGLTAKRLERFGENAFREKTPSHFSERRGRTAFGGNYRWPDQVNCGNHRNGKIVESLEVFRNGVPFRPDPASEILVVGGDTLNLPGPGHTFSGQLSLMLKYPVDELALPGEVWFQNLPAVLSRNPDRYLRGKKVCLLMLSPGMLTENTFPDIQKLSSLYARLRGKQPVHRIAVKATGKDFRLPKPVPGEQRYQQKQKWNRRWDQLGRGNPGAASLRIEEETEQPWISFNLPENRTGKPYILVVEAAVYPLQTVELTVNGAKIPLLINTDDPHFRFTAAELLPDAKKVEIKIAGKRDNRILIRNVLLYQ